MKLAANIKDIFGKVSPPPGIQVGDNPATALGNTITSAIQIAFLIAGFALLLYLMWGGIDWITAGGDPEKLERARGKIRDAFFGILVLVITLSIFTLVAGQILGIIDVSDGIRFKLPRI